MSSQQKRDLCRQTRRIEAGFPGLVALADIYGFEAFLTRERGWHSAVTRGCELLHVYRHTREIVVRYSAAKHRTVVRTFIGGQRTDSQHGMVLYYAYCIFHKGGD